MRRIQHEAESNTKRVFVGASIVRRDVSNFQGTLLDNEGRLVAQSGCISCANPPCVKVEIQQRIVESCPVKAISIQPTTRQVQISDKCISCGICALRCPIGAIEWTQDGPALVHTVLDASNVQNVASTDQEKWLLGLRLDKSTSLDSIRKVAAQITNNLKREKASVFYPLVASYLQILGLEASASNMGDTSSRADVTISTSLGTVPVEVKSFTEVKSVNLKSIQQALENKLFTARQDQESKLNGLSSLALAFSYPSDRTGLEELIEDVDGAFGIRIGIISLPRLIEAAISFNCGSIDFDSDSLIKLKGLF